MVTAVQTWAGVVATDRARPVEEAGVPPAGTGQGAGEASGVRGGGGKGAGGVKVTTPLRGWCRWGGRSRRACWPVALVMVTGV